MYKVGVIMVYVVERVKAPNRIRRIMVSSYDDFEYGDRVYPKRWEDEFCNGGFDNCWKIIMGGMPDNWIHTEQFNEVCEKLRLYNKDFFHYTGSIGDVT